MPKCPFAVWKPMPGASGSYLSGPPKIVHHTTEGHKAEHAFDAYIEHKSAPHFTVDHETIYQHFDTASFARALRNASGGVQTNRDSAVQIEVVGFAHLPKDGRTLRLVARLCRWIEQVHGVSRIWPNGYPKVATSDGRDPGGHNRDAETWDNVSGHFGHSQVPENTHWDPAYSREEVDFIMAAAHDESAFTAQSTGSGSTAGYVEFTIAGQRPDLSAAETTMPDHSHGEINPADLTN